MIAPTHMGFGAMVALLFGASPVGAGLCALGSLLPDLDAPNSVFGRLVPGTRWIYDRFGHRGFIHSLLLWVPLACLGWVWAPLGWGFGGAISHCFLDTLSLAGVRLFYPSDKLVVFGQRANRIRVGSPTEMILMVGMWLAVAGFGWVHSEGGWRMIMGEIGAYDVAVQTVSRNGVQGMELVGDWKLRTGEFVEDRGYVVIGWEETKGVGTRLALWDGEAGEVLRPFEDIVPVWVKARILPWRWGVLKSSVPVQAVGDVFFRDEGKWYTGQSGDAVMGVVKWRGR